MRILAAIFLLITTPLSWAQTSHVDPADLVLSVTLEDTGYTPYQHEMILLTIHGVYRRHITREKLEQPRFENINWMQLGPDHWYDSTINGVKVKNMRRRIALFPDKAGKLEIGRFTHHLTLLDENNKWFPHDVESEPIVLEVAKAPKTDDWWFPVRRLEVSDRWSNAPDQLQKGEGVLRIITLTATGIGADMMPPMPELKSPSAHVFPHPEKRLVELSPQGPVAITFWRWTIKPQNGVSAILEPVEFSYFDTVNRQSKLVTISPQRIAYSDQARETPDAETKEDAPAVIRAGLLSTLMVLSGIVTFFFCLGPDRVFTTENLEKRWRFFQLKRKLKRAIETRDLKTIRRISRELDCHGPENATRRHLLQKLDRKIYSDNSEDYDFHEFFRGLIATF